MSAYYGGCDPGESAGFCVLTDDPAPKVYLSPRRAGGLARGEAGMSTEELTTEDRNHAQIEGCAKLLRLYDAALARADAAEDCQRETVAQSRPYILELQSRLAEATALLELGRQLYDGLITLQQFGDRYAARLSATPRAGSGAGP